MTNKSFGSAAGAFATALVAIVAFAFPAALMAQIGTAQLNGVVSDPSGAVVPNAEVKLESTLQKFTLVATTDTSGAYTIRAIPPGEYQLSVQATGFKPEKIDTFRLSSGQASTLNVSLKLAAAATEVTVTAPPPLLQTANATVGSVVEKIMIDNLPLIGRDFTRLIQTLPGVVPAPSPDSRNNSFGFGGQKTGLVPSLYGQRQRNNNFTLDGASNNDLGGNDVNMFPPPEAIEEMKVESSMTSAAYGVGSGAAINLVTKSGTNEYHGALWESFRNADLNARSFFAPTVAGYRWNQFGGTLGGPIVSKDRGWYFFGYYEGHRTRQNANYLANVPTAAQLSGNLDDGTTPQVYNPFTTVTGPDGLPTRQPFAGNQIPSALLNQRALALAKAIYPAPNLPKGQIPGFNYINTSSNAFDQNNWSVRIDRQFRPKDNFFVRYSDRYQNQRTWGLLGASTRLTPFKNLLVSETHTFGPSMLLTSRFNITRQNRGSIPALAPGVAEQAGLLASFPAYKDPVSGKVWSLIPNIGISGYTTMSEAGNVSLPSPEVQTHINEDASKVAGRHTITFGGNFLNYKHNSLGVTNHSVSFGSSESSNFSGATGAGLASFLLGVPNNASRQLGTADGILRGNAWGLYVQEDFRLNPRLTMNFGLRYDYAAPRANEVGSAGLIWETGLYYWNKTNPVTGAPANISPGVIPPDRNNFSPRFGIAYQVSPNTVVRAGYGIFYNLFGFEYSQAQQGNRGNWPFATPETASGINSGVPDTLFPNVFTRPPNPSPIPLGFNQNLNAYGPSTRTSYVHQWTLSLQRQLTSSLKLEAVYVGSHALKLTGQAIDNVALYPGPGSYRLRQKYSYIPRYGLNAYNVFPAYYEAGVIKLEKRYGSGLVFQANYTWAKNIDFVDSAINGGGALSGAQGPQYVKRDNWWFQFKGPAGFDLAHRAVVSYVYELPFKTGSHAADLILAKWSFSGIFSADSGFPFGVRLSADNANIGWSDQFPNLVGNPNAITSRTPQQWFNTAAFAVPPPFTFCYGTCAGKNFMRGPRFYNWDFSLGKKWPVFGENKVLDLRADFFNLLNHPVFDIPGVNFPSPQFGTVSNTRNPGRDIQLQLKFVF